MNHYQVHSPSHEREFSPERVHEYLQTEELPADEKKENVPGHEPETEVEHPDEKKVNVPRNRFPPTFEVKTLTPEG
ncbi:MAG: hypothetical protein K8U57_21830 [Planctomycetes bacterium]|nr:hypothetical protein [Planctomycetota bacterium]